jgi:hypothetical protein
LEPIVKQLAKDYSGKSSLLRYLTAFRAVLVFAANQQRRDRMLKDELFLVLGLKHNGIFVKRAYVPRNLGAIQQMNCNVFAGC